MTHSPGYASLTSPQPSPAAARHPSPYQNLDKEQPPSYRDLRAEATLHAKLRAEAFQKAAHARSMKQGQIASYYAQQVQLIVTFMSSMLTTHMQS